MNHSNKKLLAEYQKVTGQVDTLQGKLEKRHGEACLISESNRAIFMPVSLI